MENVLLMKQALQWCDELDEVVQCPVCMDKPLGKVFLCTQGHHICERCHGQICTNECPTCKRNINGGRSFLTESVVAKIEDIKKAAIVFSASPPEPPKKELVTSATQYCSSDWQTNSLRVTAAKGHFPCRIGSCSKEEPHCRMMDHIKNAHTNRLNTCSTLKGETFRHSWKLNYSPATDYDIAFNITDMELFFVNLELDVDGHFHGSVQILNSNTVGKMFNYRLEVRGRNRANIVAFSFEGGVKSCRLSKEQMSDECLYIHSTNMQGMVNKDNVFECELVITRKSNQVTKKKKKKKTLQDSSQ